MNVHKILMQLYTPIQRKGIKMSGSSLNSQCGQKNIFIHDTATMAPKKANGIGAKCTVIKLCLHPAKTVKEKCPNSTHFDKLSDFLDVERKSTKVNRRDQTYITFRHDAFPTCF